MAGHRLYRADRRNANYREARREQTIRTPVRIVYSRESYSINIDVLAIDRRDVNLVALESPIIIDDIRKF